MAGWYTLKEAAAELGLNPRTLARWCAKGHVAGAQKFGMSRGLWLIPETTVKAGIKPPPRGRPAK